MVMVFFNTNSGSKMGYVAYITNVVKLQFHFNASKTRLFNNYLYGNYVVNKPIFIGDFL